MNNDINYTPTVLQNGILLTTSVFNPDNVGSHIDKAHVLSTSTNEADDITHLGKIEPLIKTGYMDPYMYQFSNFGKNRIAVKGNKYTWSTSISEEPWFIVEDLSNSPFPGRAGEKFKVKFNRKKYDNGYIITADPHEASNLLVTDDVIKNVGDGWIYTFQFLGPNQNERSYPKDLLIPGTRYNRITTTENEYTSHSEYSGLSPMSGGERTFFNMVGTHRAQLKLSVTRDAAWSRTTTNMAASLEQYHRTLDIYEFKPGTLGYALSYEGGGVSGKAAASDVSYQYKMNYGKGYKNQFKKDLVYYKWVPAMENIMMRELELMVENEAMWGAGGVIDYQGATRTQRSLGLFHQLNMGNTHIYNMFDINKEKFEYIIRAYLNRTGSTYGTDGMIEILTGKGGMAMVQNWLRNSPSAAGMTIDSKDYIQGLGKNNNTKLKFISPVYDGWSMSDGSGTICFKLAPGLDPQHVNEKRNPYVSYSNNNLGGFRLSSYMFIISDITNNAKGNIYELICEKGWDFTKGYRNGKLDYHGNNNWAIGSDHPGFEVMMTKLHKAYWLSDPTVSLIIKPINPFTGIELYPAYRL